VREIKVGDSARRSMRITEEDIEAFAKLTGDRNPLHFDDAFARSLGFNGRIAHGMLTSSILSTLLGMDIPGRGAIYLEQRVRYLDAVYPGQSITGELEVTKVRLDKPMITLAVRIVREDGTLVADGEVVVLMREARPSIAAPKGAPVSDAHSGIRGLVADIRREKGSVPDVDPDGPGSDARVVLVMLTPGPAQGGAQMTGVLSPTKNSDQTALNLRQLLREAQLDERICVFWNAIPWSLGARREPTDDEVRPRC